MSIKTIPFETHLDGKGRAAFVILHTQYPVWEQYPGLTAAQKAIQIPACLMLRRWDGMSGFPGGVVEKGETLQQAAIRELWEEVGFEVSGDDVPRMQPLVAHDIGKISTHAFALRVDWFKLVDVARCVFFTEHFGSETCGPSLEHLVDYGQLGLKPVGLNMLLRMPLATSVREELVHLILSNGYAPYESLGKTCAAAGFDIAELAEGFSRQEAVV